jgi:hypothetical protein
MPELKAVCGTCRRSFPGPFYFGPGSTGITMEGNQVSPCPLCGAREGGVIPDGVFDVGEDDVVRLVSALPTTDINLIRLAGIASKAH